MKFSLASTVIKFRNKPEKSLYISGCFTIYLAFIINIVSSQYSFGQRFIINSQVDTLSYINKGDSAFFAKSYKQSIFFYSKLIEDSDDEHLNLNQVQNYLAASDLEGALSILRSMSHNGFFKFWIIEEDEYYKDLRSTEEYNIIKLQLKNNFKSYCDTNQIRKPSITYRIMLMYYFDQYYQWMSTFKQRYPKAFTTTLPNTLDSLKQETFKKNLQALKTIISQEGFPWNSDIGEDATHYVWLMVQHADHDLPFQKKYLKELKAAVDVKNASALDLAYLTDRIRKNEGQKQIYGTQMNYKTVEDPVKGSISKMELWPVEDPDYLDERRNEVGLMPINEYFKLMNQLNGRKN